MKPPFEWDEKKNEENIRKHRVDFANAKYAFKDRKRVISKDLEHSKDEKRYYCFGKVKQGILTVRFTLRQERIRIIGAGFWRKGKKAYEEKNHIY